jgi:anti-anti-sigma factor
VTAPVEQRDSGVRVVVASGELDLDTVPPLLAQLPAWVEGGRGVVLDLSLVEFFDSSGARLVDALARACHQAEVGYRIVAPAGRLPRRVLEILSLTRCVVEDRATAEQQVLAAG